VCRQKGGVAVQDKDATCGRGNRLCWQPRGRPAGLPACAAKPCAEKACCNVNRIAVSQVRSLIPGGPAAKSGKVSEGDTLITIDKMYIDTFADGSTCTQRLRGVAARAHTHTYAYARARTHPRACAAPTACMFTLAGPHSGF